MAIRPVTRERWRFAQRMQERTQSRKAARARGDEAELVGERSRRLADELASRGVVVGPDDWVAEVGSGAHGLIWRWPRGRRIAIDPLAVFYAAKFAPLQRDAGAGILAARGEELPLADAGCALILCDNVIDHAADPAKLLRECRRVLRPDGWLYLTVHVHHPIYAAGARAYNATHRVGLELRVPAFPSHPFHLTEREARRLVDDAGFAVVCSDRIDPPARIRRGRPFDHLKRLFPKNARLRVLCRPR